MSYLNLPSGIPDFSKAVISLWFRVPQESIDAAVAVVLEPAFTFVLPFTIPLFTFGRPQTKIRYDRNAHDVAVWHYNPIDKPTIIGTDAYVAMADDPLSPSFIGIEATTDGANLVFNIQMEDHAIISQAQADSSRVDLYPSIDFVIVPGDGWQQYFAGGAFGLATIVDVSYIFNAQPEYFFVRAANKIEPEQWHHLLLSFDLSGSCSAGYPNPITTCKLWYAIDDVDYRGQEHMQPFRDEDDGIDPNGIVTENAYQISGGDGTSSFAQNVPFGPQVCNYDPGPIPSSGGNLGLPASADHVDYIYKVEMAEFQLFTGVTLDTGEIANRRAFVDEAGEPVKPELTEIFMGRRPDILLHGTKDWQDGKNTGALGTEFDSVGNEVVMPSGQFSDTGVINPYKPDPSLAPVAAPTRVRRRAGPVRLTRNARL